MHPYLKPVLKAFTAAADEQSAEGAAAYMRNQFAFFGIKSPVRKDITKSVFSNGLPGISEWETITREAWAQPQREWQYFAIDLAAKCKKHWTDASINLFEWMVINKSWWDTVDAISSQLNSPWFLKYPEQIKPVTGKWNLSDNIWLQRCSILFQNPYKNKTDTTLLKKYILHLKDSNEFFIRKAIGWALRDYSGTDPEWVREFVRKNKLSGLSEREALKRIGK